ncbi:hypothetical protein GQ54DRAFT_295148 [Martensiomyces pterosporus]|nr:hypothetical protein GQ54DRAFT_295148 [Martensiomyces pterosporus]
MSALCVIGLSRLPSCFLAVRNSSELAVWTACQARAAIVSSEQQQQQARLLHVSHTAPFHSCLCVFLAPAKAHKAVTPSYSYLHGILLSVYLSQVTCCSPHKRRCIAQADMASSVRAGRWSQAKARCHYIFCSPICS